MSGALPIELVCEILRTTAEEWLLAHKPTVMNIILTSALGYGAATPVLYRTLYVHTENQRLVLRVFDESESNASTGSCNASAILRDPPARRLCPLIRRLFLNRNSDLKPEDVKRLVRLERFMSYEDAFWSIDIFEALPLSVTYLALLQHTESYHITPLMTHISYPFSLGANEREHILHGLLKSPSASAVTHIALDINESAARRTGLDRLQSIIRAVLARDKIQMLSLHLFDAALDLNSRPIFLEAMQQVVTTEEDRRRFAVWDDYRSVAHKASVHIEDFVLGENAWTEGQPIS